MSRRQDVSPTKIKAAADQVSHCFEAVEAAFRELRSREVQFARLLDVNTAAFQRRLENRILTAALALQRLEGATRRLLKRLGQDIKAFEKLLASSLAISVTSRLANSWKHGLGGQRKNATLLNGVLTVRRSDGHRDEEGQERVHVLGMMVTDAADGAFASNVLLEQSVKDWGVLLGPLMPAAASWVERVAPKPQGVVVKGNPGSKPVVPLGATLILEIPDEMRSLLASEAKRRSESA